VTTEEAVSRCDFWTTNVAETIAIGSTSDPLVGLHFNGDEYQRERWSNPSKLGWGITVPRWVVHEDEDGERTRIENLAYRMIVAEIARRVGT
jgi:hypothetical protein